jgi:trimeric autotransporter adhesin
MKVIQMFKSGDMKIRHKVVLLVWLFMAVAISSAARQRPDKIKPGKFIVIDAHMADRMMLLPKVALTGITDQQTISTGTGLQVYNTATVSGEAGVSPGYYLWVSTQWVRLPYQPENLNLKSATGEDQISHGNDSLVGFTGRNEGNTAYGVDALRHSAIGSPNTALGYSALSDIATGSQNTAIGYYALRTTATGSQNVGVGQGVLFSNTAGSCNTAIGLNVLFGNTTGTNNTALGHAVLTANSTGINNTALGQAALQNATGSNNTAVGQQADVTKTAGNNCTTIGYDAATGDNSDCVQVGNKEIVSIGGQVAWSTRSDRRIKKFVNENVPGLDFIVKLKPVNYRFNLAVQDSIMGTKADTSATGAASREKAEAVIHTGFVAQDVEETLKTLDYSFDAVVKPQNPTDLYSLSYELFTIPLVKAVQEQQKTLKKQQTDIEMLQRLIQYQQQQIEELKRAMQALLKKN